MRRLWLALGAFFIGCSTPHDRPLPYPLTLSPEGLGPIRPGSAFDPAAIQGKLPGFAVEKISRVTPGRSETILLLKRDGRILAHIFPDVAGETITRVSVVSALISDDTGRKVGDPRSTPLECGDAECLDRSRPALRYHLAPGGKTISEISVVKL